MDCRRFIANNLWLCCSLPNRLNFIRSLKKVPVVQEQVLLKYLRKNKGTIFGKQHGFDRIHSAKQFQQEIPLTTFEDYCPYIEKIMQGEKHVLTKDRVLQLHLSSGTSSASKHLPFTPSLQEEFERGLTLWIGDLYLRFPELKHGSAYWVFTPMKAPCQNEKSCVPIGFDQDEDYFRPIKKRLLRNIIAVPPEVQHIHDIQDLYYVTLLFLLSDKNLTWISVWNPSFIPLLLACFSDRSGQLISDLSSGVISPSVKIPGKLKSNLEKRLPANPKRAKEIENIWKECSKNSAAPWVKFWPRLSLISCWTDAWARNEISAIRHLFPGIVIQGKGLLATEGYMTLPFHIRNQRLPAPVLSVTTHFYEFLDTENNETYLAHELKKDKTYEIVITTGGGLYRYRLYDLVRVEAHFGQAPCLRFLGKTGMISDVRGEKLNETHIRKILDTCFLKYGITPDFYFMAPETTNGHARYVLYIEDREVHQKTGEMLEDIDQSLKDNFHYAYCRRLGQLDAPVCFLLDKGSKELYIREKTKMCRLGTLKISCLENKQGWSTHLPGKYTTV